jgi:hypothetical protein
MFGERGRREPCGHRGNFLGRERNSAAWRRNHAVTAALRCYLGDCRQTKSGSKNVPIGVVPEIIRCAHPFR